jgi:hypothetical protein
MKIPLANSDRTAEVDDQDYEALTALGPWYEVEIDGKPHAIRFVLMADDVLRMHPN